MGAFFTMYTLIAFLLGVLLSGYAKGLFSQVKGKVSGA